MMSRDRFRSIQVLLNQTPNPRTSRKIGVTPVRLDHDRRTIHKNSAQNRDHALIRHSLEAALAELDALFMRLGLPAGTTIRA